MIKAILNKLNIAFTVLVLLGVFSCSEEDVDINNVGETIIVRHKQADMPVYIHGNMSEKVFLIILHGGPGGTGLQYRVNTIKSEIEINNAVVYFDQRGSGNSQGSYSEDNVSLDIMAEDVLALVKVLKAKYGDDSRFFLMGHSWGGTLGPATLLKDQEGFSGWIDVDGMHDPKGSYNAYKIALKEAADAQITLQNNIEYWESVLELVQNVGANYSVEDFFKLNRETHKAENKLAEDKVIFESKSEGGTSQNSRLVSWNSRQIVQNLAFKEDLFGKVSFTDRLPEITIPSLVLWGKHDIIVPTVYAQEAFDNLGAGDKELFVFENSGHSPMFSEPDLFSEKVIEFINKHK